MCDEGKWARDPAVQHTWEITGADTGCLLQSTQQHTLSAHTNSADTPSWQIHANLHLLHFLKTHEKWLINIKSRNPICWLCVREWLSQQKVPTALSLTQIHDTYLSVLRTNERGRHEKEEIEWEGKLMVDACHWLNVYISVHPSSTSHFIMPARDNSMEMKWQ